MRGQCKRKALGKCQGLRMEQSKLHLEYINSCELIPSAAPPSKGNGGGGLQ